MIKHSNSINIQNKNKDNEREIMWGDKKWMWLITKRAICGKGKVKVTT